MKSKILKYKNTLPLLVLALISIQTIYFSVFQQVGTLSFKHYIAFLFLLITIGCYIFSPKIFKYAIVILLIIALFNFVNFFVAEYQTMIRIGSVKLYFQGQILLLIILTYFINFKNVNNVFSLKGEEKIIKEKKYSNEQIDEFKKRYALKSIEELSKILKDERFTFEAKESARILIEAKTIEQSKTQDSI